MYKTKTNYDTTNLFNYNERRKKSVSNLRWVFRLMMGIEKGVVN